MKNIFHKIMSVTMALLLLASTTSWKVEKHYCMGHLVDVAFFLDADTCGMDMDLSNEGATEIQKENSCCSDEVVIIDAQDDLKLSFDDIPLGQQFFLFSFSNSYINLFEHLAEQIVPHELYPPPILVKDISLFDQVFLI